MGFLNKKYQLDPLQEKNKHNRRSFMTKSVAALFGVTFLAKADDLFAIKSKTGLIYIKQNGEIINNYKPFSSPDPYLSEIGLFSFNFAPQGWAQCNGQLLPIAQYSALFSLLGINYGGDGITNFRLPDLRGRSPLHFGQGNGLSYYPQGLSTGTESITLVPADLPPHNHGLVSNSGVGTTSNPSNNYIAAYGEGVKSFSNSANATMNAAVVSNTGGSQAHSNIQPYTTLCYCIALQGMFPSQS